jgi:hypothetical protein
VTDRSGRNRCRAQWQTRQLSVLEWRLASLLPDIRCRDVRSQEQQGCSTCLSARSPVLWRAL